MTETELKKKFKQNKEKNIVRNVIPQPRCWGEVRGIRSNEIDLREGAELRSK